MKKNILFFLLIIFAVAGCNQKEKTADTDTAAHDPLSHEHAGDPGTAEIMAIHDSIMPRMDDIMQLKAKVKKEIKSLDSLLAQKSNPGLVARRKAATEIVDKLDMADHEMMGWMHQYKADTLKTLTAEQAESYLKDQKSKITDVKKIMESTLEEAALFTSKK